MSEVAMYNGVDIKLNSEVINYKQKKMKFLMCIQKDNLTTKPNILLMPQVLIRIKVHNMVCEKEFEILPSKGNIFYLIKSRNLVNHVLFQCPSKVGKGV